MDLPRLIHRAWVRRDHRWHSCGTCGACGRRAADRSGRPRSTIGTGTSTSRPPSARSLRASSCTPTIAPSTPTAVHTRQPLPLPIPLTEEDRLLGSARVAAWAYYLCVGRPRYSKRWCGATSHPRRARVSGTSSRARTTGQPSSTTSSLPSPLLACRPMYGPPPTSSLWAVGWGGLG